MQPNSYLRACGSSIAAITTYLLLSLVCNARASLDLNSELSIPPQDLTSALLTLGKQADLSVIIAVDIGRDYTSAPIQGNMSAREALVTLLRETNFAYRELSPNIVSIIVQPKIELPQASERPDKTEHVNVIGQVLTGSHIRRHQEDGLAPLDIISNLEIERSGSQTLADLIKFIPAVSGNSTSTAVSNGGDGTTKVTLRGLPANNTLVLVNGQRVVFDGLAGDSVDLNAIAPIAIDRLEILKDGASAIYGSDAIAGVVNIVMKDEFQGALLEQYAGISSRGDTETLATNGLWGQIGSRNSLLVAVSHYRQDGLFSRERALSEDADGRDQGGTDRRSSATPFTRLTLGSGDDSQALILDTDAEGKALPGTNAAHFRSANSEDVYNFRSQTSSISPSQRLGIYSSLINYLDDGLSLHSFLLMSRTDATITLASSPIYTGFIENRVTVSADNVYNPFGEDLSDVRRRVVELDPREQRNIAENVHMNTGLHYLNSDFEWSSKLYWNRTEASEEHKNLVDGTRLSRALGPADQCLGTAIDGCEALNIFGPPGSIDDRQLAYIKTRQRSEGFSQIYGMNLNFSSVVAKSRHGNIVYATGLDWRREESLFNPDANNEDNIIGTVFKTTTRGSREVREIYGEIRLPLMSARDGASKLDTEFAARYTSSSDYGDNLAPKIGLKFYPLRELLVRSTVSSGFRAPSINELYKSGARSYAAILDPCAVEENVNQLVGCTQQSDKTLNQFLTEYRGFANLKPEESINFTAGFYFTPKPISQLSFSADFFAIRQKNVIDANPQTIVDENARSGMFQDFVKRDTNGNITFLSAPFINIGRRLIQGIDFSAHYIPQHKALELNLNASYLLRYLNKLNEFTLEENLAGTFNDAAQTGSGSLPRWKINSGFTLKNNSWEWNYALNFISSLKEEFQTDTLETRRIDHWLTHNSQLQWMPKNALTTKFTFGIDNIFDSQPPFSASAFNDNYDARTYDLKGRFFYTKVSFDF